MDDPVETGASVTAWPKGISAITLFVEDMTAAKLFYQAVFDLPVHYEDDASTVFQFGNTLINLLETTAVPELIKPASIASREAGHRFVLTITVDDVDAICARLAERGVTLLNGPMDRPWGMRTASFMDPGGHIWEIASKELGMNKSELLHWLKEEYRQFQALLDEIGPARMALPGVAAHWSMKDILAHLNGWHPTLLGPMQAALRGEPKPPPPWPAHLKTDDEINAWIYDSGRERPLSEILAESEQQFQQLIAIIEALPDDVSIEPDWRVVHIGDKRFAAGEYFDHFHDEHEPDIRAWLEKVEAA